MRKLKQPQITYQKAFDVAVSGVGSAAQQTHYHTHMPNCKTLEEGYVAAGKAASLHAIPRIASAPGSDPEVVPHLKKSELTKLYTQYFVPDKKPARAIYDELLVTTNGKCPFCGDIGQVRTLDHYLPKANFPLYSVLPANLVPCCRDCNTDKLNVFSLIAGDQSLHPYLDDDKYFTKKWIDARIIPGDPPVVEFFVSPPTSWLPLERSRVIAHFRDYNLAGRFGVEAAADLPETILMRKTIMELFSPKEYSNYLLERSQNSSIVANNWRRIMYASLSTDAWFCTTTF